MESIIKQMGLKEDGGIVRDYINRMKAYGIYFDVKKNKGLVVSEGCYKGLVINEIEYRSIQFENKKEREITIFDIDLKEEIYFDESFVKKLRNSITKISVLRLEVNNELLEVYVDRYRSGYDKWKFDKAKTIKLKEFSLKNSYKRIRLFQSLDKEQDKVFFTEFFKGGVVKFSIEKGVFLLHNNRNHYFVFEREML